MTEHTFNLLPTFIRPAIAKLAFVLCAFLVLAAPSVAQQSVDIERSEQPAGRAANEGNPSADTTQKSPAHRREAGQSRGKLLELIEDNRSLYEPGNAKARQQILSDLYAHLAAAESPYSAQKYSQAIEGVWLDAGSDTISVLMERALTAAKARKYDVSIKIMDSVVALAPDFAEGWNRRAVIYYMQQNKVRALGDLRRVLALDPNHFKALDGMAKVMDSIGQKQGALQALESLKQVHPFWVNIDKAIEELKRELKGQGI